MSALRCVNAAWLGVCLAALPALAADAPDIDKVCAERTCRAGGFEAVVAVDSEHYSTVPVSRSPYLLTDGSLLIFPGETIAVQFAIDGDSLGKPVAAQRYAPHYPALIVESGGSPKTNPDDAALPQTKRGTAPEELAGLPDNTVLISYGQMEPRGLGGMQLVAEHNFHATLKFDALINVIEPHAYRSAHSSTCPVRQGLIMYESWPDRLGPIVLSNIRFLAAGDAMTCD